jgi:hypothetical protein
MEQFEFLLDDDEQLTSSGEHCGIMSVFHRQLLLVELTSYYNFR